MKKPYFANYLPVEGELKEGDWYKSKFRTENKFFHYEQWKDDRTTYFGNNPKEDVLFKVKLFLCSKDIKLYDEVYNPILEKYETVIKDLWEGGNRAPETCTDFQEVEQCGSFKVIGEISSAAVWVTDGMEFDKDEIKLSKHPECPYCGAFSNDGFCPHETDCQIDKKRTVAYIQGPCTHFH